jgi:tRNA-specific 2-thiouridylase
MGFVREKVVVAMSGGVDSSVAACLLVEQGYEVIGLFMRVGHHGAAEIPTTEGSADRRTHQGCCSASDAADARFVAGMLGIPFYALNFEKDFDAIIDHFADEYARGRTPNPCVMCNDRLKFGRLVEYADAVGARYVATGHYARIDRCGGSPRLLRGVDARKDQSYVLFGLGREVLDRILFPVGDLRKDEVRRIAAKHNLPNQHKPDSVEICFVPDRNYARVVRDRRPDGFSEGEVVDFAGLVIGRHGGIANYTIGQRRGLGIAAGKPMYVTQLDVLNNRVVMGGADDLLSAGLVAERVNLLADVVAAAGPDGGESRGSCEESAGSGSAGAGSFRAQVKIRYLHEAALATVRLLPRRRANIAFDAPQRAVTPGQAVVFYDGDRVLGGGWIESPFGRTGA